MPHKLNEDRRHKIPKQKFKVTNWAAYNESPRQRGNLTGLVAEILAGRNYPLNGVDFRLC